MSEPLIRVRVWDLPIRLFHWSLVVLVAFAWWAWKTDRMEWHRYAGYAVISLLVFRLYWGVFGSATARFANFVRGPRAVWRYVTGRAEPVLGHNPIGGWSILALLAVLAVQTGSGLYATDDEGLESGPLADSVSYNTSQLAEQWHGIAFNVLLGLIALHVAAIVFYLLYGSNLIGPMISGNKRLRAQSQSPARAGHQRLVVGIILTCAVFFTLWWVDGA